MDSMIMAVRISLLIIATGTFTALWSGDHPEKMACVECQRKVLFGQNKSRQRRNVIRSCHDVAVLESASQANDKAMSVPLPKGISAGTYLVADQFGRTEIRIVSEQIANAACATSIDDTHHFSVVVGNARWHYIRVDQAVPERIAVSPRSGESIR